MDNLNPDKAAMKLATSLVPEDSIYYRGHWSKVSRVTIEGNRVFVLLGTGFEGAYRPLVFRGDEKVTVQEGAP